MMLNLKRVGIYDAIVLESNYASNIDMMMDLTLAWKLLKLNGVLILRDSTPDQTCESKKRTLESFLSLFPGRSMFREEEDDATFTGARPVVSRHCGNTFIRKYLRNMKVVDESGRSSSSSVKTRKENPFPSVSTAVPDDKMIGGLNNFMREGTMTWRGKLK